MLYHFLCPNQVPSFISKNTQYLEIFGFNLIDFMCFGDKRNAGLFSIPQSQWSFSSFQKMNIKKRLRQILRYITPVANF